MSNKNIFTSLLLTCVITLTCTLIADAQILPPPPPDPSAIPLDPLSWLLLGTGGLVAGKKYLDNKKLKK